MVDDNYKTYSNTRFYNRKWEMNFLLNRVMNFSFIILYGPRNIGKSELLRFLSFILKDSGWFIYYVDVREYLSRRQLTIYPETIDHTVFLQSVLDIVGLPDRVLDLFEAGYRYAVERRACGVLWAFDEPHYLPNARPFLEALVKRVLYSFHDRPLSVIISVSDGWFIVSDAMVSLLEYGAETLFVDELDPGSFRGLYSELSMVRKVVLDIDPDILYSRYVGGNPGYLVELLNHGDLGRWGDRVEKVFLAKVNNITGSTEFSRREVLEYMASLPKEIDLGCIGKREYRLLMELVKNNLVYYDIMSVETLVKPQIPFYRELSQKLLSKLRQHYDISSK